MLREPKVQQVLLMHKVQLVLPEHKVQPLFPFHNVHYAIQYPVAHPVLPDLHMPRTLLTLLVHES